jgi:hypothetical protein
MLVQDLVEGFRAPIWPGNQASAAPTWSIGERQRLTLKLQDRDRPLDLVSGFRL